MRAIKAGATDFIPKPWEKEKLLATLSAALKLREKPYGSAVAKTPGSGFGEFG